MELTDCQGNTPIDHRSEKWNFPRRKIYVKRSRFTDSKIMPALERVEAGMPVPETCRELGHHHRHILQVARQVRRMDTSMMTHMKELEDENRRLRKMYLEEKL